MGTLVRCVQTLSNQVEEQTHDRLLCCLYCLHEKFQRNAGVCDVVCRPKTANIMLQRPRNLLVVFLHAQGGGVVGAVRGVVLAKVSQ